MHIIRILATTALSFFLLTSCDNDPDNIYGKNKEMQIRDEYGNITTHAYASIASGTFLYIIGGIGKNHIVEAADDGIFEVHYSHRAAGHSFIQTETIPASVHIIPKKFGSTVISITDSDIDQTIHVKVEVVNEYSALTISGSTVQGMEDGMKLAFIRDDKNEYRVVSQEGRQYHSEEKGEYHFWKDEEEYTDPGHLMLTLKCGDEETTWKITDADNNKDGNKYYHSDILEGLQLPYSVTTKFSPAIHYPTAFLFTDISDQNRHFNTGPANSTIKYSFE